MRRRTAVRALAGRRCCVLLTAEERSAFNRLRTAEACRDFIDQFWRKRDPDPKTSVNESKEEHYRRVSYANQRFSYGSTAGWRTDRGRIYIVHGPPSLIEAYPSGVTRVRPPEEGGGLTATYPFERWRYEQLPAMGESYIELEFVDRNGEGEYRLVETIDARRRSGLRGGR